MSAPPARPPFTVHGRRRGRRLRPGRQRLLETLLPRLAIDLPPPGGRLDPVRLFARPPSDVWLEIGFGAGEHLAWQAQRNPEVGFVGCEVFVNGVAGLLGQVARLGLDNVRVFPDDARGLIEALPDACLGRVFLLFPDPWPKARHGERRFIGRDNLGRLARVLKDGAELRVATDDPGTMRWTLEHALRHPDFRWPARRPADWRDRPPDWPPTRYEEKALAAGRRPIYLRFERRPRA